MKKNKNKEKSKKVKSVFHKKSDAGKGDVPRQGIPHSKWEERWEKIFRPKGKEFFEGTGSK